MRAIANWMFNFGLMELLIILFIMVNFITFSLYVIDKRKSLGDKWRISENMLIFFTLLFGGTGAFLAMRLVKHKTKKKKFKIAVVFSLLISVIPLFHVVHSLTFDKIIRYREVEIFSENWPSGLENYRIAFMTDMHEITHESMRKVIAELNNRNIDLLVLGGDFHMKNEYYIETLNEIANINTTDGIYGVEGNHDDYKRLFAAMESHGMTPLENNGIQIREGFYLAGVQDMWVREPDINAAIASAKENDFVLLLSHNPDISMVQPTYAVDLILSGHTHGGQITFFGIPIYLLRGSITSYGMRFSNGFADSADGTPVYTSSGIGDYSTTPRVFARPEVVIFTMK